jgi:hypothetical protein
MKKVFNKFGKDLEIVTQEDGNFKRVSLNQWSVISKSCCGKTMNNPFGSLNKKGINRPSLKRTISSIPSRIIEMENFLE